MLFLRRNQNERIVIFDPRAEVWVRVISIDMDSAILSIGPGKMDDARVELALYDEISILQGDGKLVLKAIADYNDGTHYASIGVQAPRDMKIHREEQLAGMRREDRQRLA